MVCSRLSKFLPILLPLVENEITFPTDIVNYWLKWLWLSSLYLLVNYYA